MFAVRRSTTYHYSYDTDPYKWESDQSLINFTFADYENINHWYADTGMSNGFMLLPVILSFIGQTENVLDPADENSDSDNEDENRMTKELPQTDRRDSVFQLSGDNQQKQLELANMHAEEEKEIQVDEKKPKRDS